MLLLLIVMLFAALIVSGRCGHRIASRRPHSALSLMRASSYDTVDIPIGLKEHVRRLIRSSLDSWENSSAEERACIEANVLTYLSSKHDGNHARKFLDSAVHVTKALKALRSDYVRTSSALLGSKESFNEELASVISAHARHLDTNRRMFNHINSHHQTLALSEATFDEEIKDQSALKTYGEAALQMGNKKWIIDSQVRQKLFRLTINLFGVYSVEMAGEIHNILL